MAPRFSASLSVIRWLILLGSWDLGRFVFAVYRGIHRSILLFLFFSLHPGEVPSVLYRSLASHSRVVQSIRFTSKICSLRFSFVTFLSYLAWYIRRTLSLLGSQFNTHTSIYQHRASSQTALALLHFLSSILHRSPLPPSNTIQPSSHNTARM